ncbi:hypothetical protein FZC33_03530 [Labrys sp. KNU-23]|uniref:hypothetical protein n=1 Tax=Labrys sp. KNU-23 TaxID=2789216 RepID=UPI0011EE7608|nr:hypothetical protein [Labrys sp. KNU-23]QEN85333.1 hypothetical protein FZC33_03530 [Labrys sp. KNU-23]
MQLADAAIGAVSAAPPQSQPTQPEANVEHQLFDYLVEMEKSVGKTGQPNDPAALVGGAIHSLEGVVQQAQSAFTKNGPQAGTASPASEGTGNAATGNERAPGQPNADLTLDRAISFMWAAANVSVAINSVTAATGSVNTLIKQQ